jgi:hypothetical protein
LTVVVGLAIAGGAATLGAGNAAALDRVAFAVDGVESSHGADVKM